MHVRLCMQVCTFDDNRQQILRCAICDAVRGTSLDHFMGHHAEVSSAAQHDAVQDSASKTGSRGRRPGSEGAGSKQKSILGFFAGPDASQKTMDAQGQASSLGGSIVAPEQALDRGFEPGQSPHPASTGKPPLHTENPLRFFKFVILLQALRPTIVQLSFIAFRKVARLHMERLQHHYATRLGHVSADVTYMGGLLATGVLWEAGGSGVWLCKQCSQRVPETEKQTHEDFHVALEMSKGQAGAPHF